MSPSPGTDTPGCRTHEPTQAASRDYEQLAKHLRLVQLGQPSASQMESLANFHQERKWFPPPLWWTQRPAGPLDRGLPISAGFRAGFGPRHPITVKQFPSSIFHSVSASNEGSTIV
ncbi:hypothetical protein PGTUg99_010009 [Puccinia graminis f. sp. tritici]|uniref:Uncharacterized protein n=1 Tax=Puccinia graminis f. sp. tritici TaxID=56615 RepID=A0A5B0QME3_PUCGR|nr:hypothetical protein PGTUg99_010009 [Puccinia graminis f. sp. tritici]